MSLGGKMKNQKLSRRDFLQTVIIAIQVITSLVLLKGLSRFFSAQVEPLPKTEFNVGPLTNFPPGSRTVIPEVPTMILNLGNDISAISLVCTHLGCTVESKPEGFTCPCHGSKFDLKGQVVRGPAKTPLNKLRIEITKDNTVKVFTN
jgi:cytochrome b6-f complex iron-sulfur subunit